MSARELRLVLLYFGWAGECLGPIYKRERLGVAPEVRLGLCRVKLLQLFQEGGLLTTHDHLRLLIVNRRVYLAAGC